MVPTYVSGLPAQLRYKWLRSLIKAMSKNVAYQTQVPTLHRAYDNAINRLVKTQGGSNKILA